MKQMLMLAVSLGCAFAVQSSVEIVMPAKGAMVPLLSARQKAYLALPRDERRKWLVDEARRKEMTALGWLPQPVELRWRSSGAVDIKVFLGDVCVFATNGVRDYVTVDNLEIARTYRWTATDGDGTVRSTFCTEDVAPRLLRIEGVPNARDLGGRIGLGGRRVRQGLVFRTAGLNRNASADCLSERELRQAWKDGTLEKTIASTVERGNGRTPDAKAYAQKIARLIEAGKPIKADYSRIFAKLGTQRPGAECLTPASRSCLLGRLGVRSDIDLRSDFECFGMTGSPLGPAVKWFHFPSYAYAGLQKDEGKAAFRNVFKVFLDRRNYPIDFHCIAGQDRTGSVAFVLNGLLGVSEEELYRDWEVSAFWNGRLGFNHRNKFDKLVAGFSSYPGDTLHSRIEAYVLALGFTKDDIAAFRRIMLEPEPAGG